MEADIAKIGSVVEESRIAALDELNLEIEADINKINKAAADLKATDLEESLLTTSETGPAESVRTPSDRLNGEVEGAVKLREAEASPAPTFTEAAERSATGTIEEATGAATKMTVAEAKSAIAAARGLRLSKIAVITSVVTTTAAVGLINYAHAGQRALAEDYKNQGLLSEEAYKEYMEINNRVTTVMTAETVGNQFLITVPFGIMATEMHAKSEFETFSNKYNLPPAIHEALGMSFLDGESLRGQFANGVMDVLPAQSSEVPLFLYDLWEAKQNFVEAERKHANAKPRGRGATTERREAWETGPTAERLEITERRYHEEFSKVFSNSEASDALLSRLPKSTLRELLESTLVYNVKESSHPSIRKLSEMTNRRTELEETMETMEDMDEFVKVHHAVTDLTTEIINNPEIINGYIRNVFVSNTPDSAEKSNDASLREQQMERAIASMSDLQKSVLIEKLAKSYSADEVIDQPHMRSLRSLYQQREELENMPDSRRSRAVNMKETRKLAVNNGIAGLVSDLRRTPHVLAKLLSDKLPSDISIEEALAEYKLEQGDLRAYFAEKMDSGRVSLPERLDVKGALAIGQTTGLLRLEDFLSEKLGIPKERLHIGVEVDSFRIQGINYVALDGTVKSVDEDVIEEVNRKLAWIDSYHDAHTVNIPNISVSFNALQDTDSLQSAFLKALEEVDVSTETSPEIRDLAIIHQTVKSEEANGTWFNSKLNAAERSRDSLLEEYAKAGRMSEIMAKLGVPFSDKTASSDTGSSGLRGVYNSIYNVFSSEKAVNIADITANPALFLNDISGFNDAVSILLEKISENPAHADVDSWRKSLNVLYTGSMSDNRLMQQLSAEMITAIQQQVKDIKSNPANTLPTTVSSLHVMKYAV